MSEAAPNTTEYILRLVLEAKDKMLPVLEKGAKEINKYKLEADSMNTTLGDVNEKITSMNRRAEAAGTKIGHMADSMDRLKKSVKEFVTDEEDLEGALKRNGFLLDEQNDATARKSDTTRGASAAMREHIAVQEQLDKKNKESAEAAGKAQVALAEHKKAITADKQEFAKLLRDDTGDQSIKDSLSKKQREELIGKIKDNDSAIQAGILHKRILESAAVTKTLETAITDTAAAWKKSSDASKEYADSRRPVIDAVDQETESLNENTKSSEQNRREKAQAHRARGKELREARAAKTTPAEKALAQKRSQNIKDVESAESNLRTIRKELKPVRVGLGTEANPVSRRDLFKEGFRGEPRATAKARRLYLDRDDAEQKLKDAREAKANFDPEKFLVEAQARLDAEQQDEIDEASKKQQAAEDAAFAAANDVTAPTPKPRKKAPTAAERRAARQKEEAEAAAAEAEAEAASKRAEKRAEAAVQREFLQEPPADLDSAFDDVDNDSGFDGDDDPYAFGGSPYGMADKEPRKSQSKKPRRAKTEYEKQVTKVTALKAELEALGRSLTEYATAANKGEIDEESWNRKREVTVKRLGQIADGFAKLTQVTTQAQEGLREVVNKRDNLISSVVAYGDKAFKKPQKDETTQILEEDESRSEAVRRITLERAEADRQRRAIGEDPRYAPKSQASLEAERLAEQRRSALTVDRRSAERQATLERREADRARRALGENPQFAPKSQASIEAERAAEIRRNAVNADRRGAERQATLERQEADRLRRAAGEDPRFAPKSQQSLEADQAAFLRRQSAQQDRAADERQQRLERQESDAARARSIAEDKAADDRQTRLERAESDASRAKTIRDDKTADDRQQRLEESESDYQRRLDRQAHARQETLERQQADYERNRDLRDQRRAHDTQENLERAEDVRQSKIDRRADERQERLERAETDAERAKIIREDRAGDERQANLERAQSDAQRANIIREDRAADERQARLERAEQDADRAREIRLDRAADERQARLERAEQDASRSNVGRREQEDRLLGAVEPITRRTRDVVDPLLGKKKLDEDVDVPALNQQAAALSRLSADLRKAGSNYDFGSDRGKEFSESQRVVDHQLRDVTRRLSEHDTALRKASAQYPGLIGKLGQFQSAIQRNSDGLSTLDNKLQGLLVLAVLAFADQLTSALISLVGALGAVASSAIAAGGAIGGVLAAGIAQAVPAVGLLIAAASRVKGVLDVLKQSDLVDEQSFTRANDTAKKRADTTDAVANAQDGLISANEGLESANEALSKSHEGVTDALEGVGDANEKVKEAQKSLLEAQKNVGTERKEAIRQIRDLIQAERDAELAARGAALSQKDAQEALRKAVASGDSSAVENAEQRVLEADQSVNSARASLTDARSGRRQAARGVEAQDNVKNARKGVKDARKNVADARDGVKDAKDNVVDARKAVEDAERGVVKAERAVEKAARGVDKARRGSDAAAADSFTAAEKLKYLLEQLSPAERRLYESAKRLKETYKKEIGPITDVIVDAFSRGLDTANDLLKDNRVQGALKRMSKGIAGSLDEIRTAFSAGPIVDQMVRISDEGTKNLKPLTAIAINLGKAFLNIAEAAGPSLRRVLGYFKDVSKDILDTTSDTDKLSGFFDRATDSLLILFRAVGATIKLIAALVDAGQPVGDSIFEDYTKYIDGLAKAARENKGGVTDFFEESKKGLYILLPLFPALFKALGEIFNPERMKPLVEFITETFLPAITDAMQIIGALTTLIFKILDLPLVGNLAQLAITLLLVNKTFKATGGLAASMLGSMTELAKVLDKLSGGSFNQLLGKVGALIGKVPGLGKLGEFFEKMGRKVSGAADETGDLADETTRAADQASSAGSKFSGAFDGMRNAVGGVVDKLGELIKKIPGLSRIGDAFKGLAGKIKRTRTAAQDTTTVIDDFGNEVQVPRRNQGGVVDDQGNLVNPTNPNGPDGPETRRAKYARRVRTGLKIGAIGVGAYAAQGADQEELKSAQNNYYRRNGGLDFTSDAVKNIGTKITSFDLKGSIKGVGQLLGIGGKDNNAKDIEKFANTYEASLDKLTKKRDAKGLDELANKAKTLAKNFPQFADALNETADKATNAAQGARNLNKRLEDTKDVAAKLNKSGIKLSIETRGSTPKALLEDLSYYLDALKKGIPTTLGELRRDIAAQIDRIRAVFTDDNGVRKAGFYEAMEETTKANIKNLQRLRREGKITQEQYSRDMRGMRQATRLFGASLDDAKDIGKEFGDRFKNTKRPVKKTIDDIIADLDKMPIAARRAAAAQAINIAHETDKGRPNADKAAKRLSVAVGKRWRGMRDINVKRAGQMADGTVDAFGKVPGGLKGPFEALNTVVNSVLKNYDAKPVPTKVEAPKGFISGILGQVTKFADSVGGENDATGGIVGRGKAFFSTGTGLIGNEGERGKDDIPALIGRGEMVLNAGHQRYIQPAVEAFYGHPLGKTFERIRGFHRGGYQDGFSGFAGGFAGKSPSGNKTVPIPGFPGEFIAKKVVGDAVALAKRFKMLITDAFATSGHSGAGHLKFGTAMDTVPGKGGSWATVNKAVKYATDKGLTVLYDGRFGSRAYPNHGEGHHAHFELQPGRVGGGSADDPDSPTSSDVQRVKLKVPKVTGGKRRARVVRGALARVIAGAQKKLDKAYEKKKASEEADAASFGSDAGSIDPSKYKGGVLSAGTVAKIARQALDFYKIRTKRGLWEKMLVRQAYNESTFNPNAENKTADGAAAGGPQGLMQVVKGTFAANKARGHNNPFNPLDSMLAAVKYIIATYGKGNTDVAAERMWARGGGAYARGGIVGIMRRLFARGGYGYPLDAKAGKGGGPAAHRDRAFGNWESDHAVDLLINQGHKVLAVADGTIKKPLTGSWKGGKGNPDGFNITLNAAKDKFFYTHLKKRFDLGNRVTKGQVLGISGAAAGVNHLHLGQKFGNPEQFFDMSPTGVTSDTSADDTEAKSKKKTVAKVSARGASRRLVQRALDQLQGGEQSEALSSRRKGLDGTSAGSDDDDSALTGKGKIIKYAASLFGGGGDPGTGHTGYRGDDLRRYPNSFAELSNNWQIKGTAGLDYAAMGKLPYKTKFKVVGPNGKSAVVEKRDVGKGGKGIGSAKRGIDLWYAVAKKLGVTGVNMVKVQRLAEGGLAGVKQIGGTTGAPTNVKAHGGEWILNPHQQGKIASLLGVSRSALKAAMGFAGKPSTGYAGGGEISDSEDSLNREYSSRGDALRRKRATQGIYDLPLLPIEDFEDVLREMRRATQALAKNAKSWKGRVAGLNSAIAEIKKDTTDAEDEKIAELKKGKVTAKDRKKIAEIQGRMTTREQREVAELRLERELLEKGVGKTRAQRRKSRRAARAEANRDEAYNTVNEIVKEDGLYDTATKERERAAAKRARGSIFSRFSVVGSGYKALGGNDAALIAANDGLTDATANRDAIAAQRKLVTDSMAATKKRLNKLKGGKGGLTKDESKEARKLEAQLGILRTKFDEIRTAEAESISAVYEAQIAQQQAVVDQINKRADRANTATDLARRAASAIGRDDLVSMVNGAQLDNLRRQAAELGPQIAKARAMGNTELADQLQDQVNDINITIFEGIQQMARDAADAVNKSFERRNRGLDLSKRVAAAYGDKNWAAAVEMQSRQSALDQISALGQARDRAASVGNSGLAQEIQDQIDELYVVVIEMTSQAFRTAADAINERAQDGLDRAAYMNRAADVFGKIGLDSSVGGMTRRAAFAQTGAALTQQRGDLASTLAQVIASQPQNVGLIKELTKQIGDLDLTIQENTKAYFDARVAAVNDTYDRGDRIRALQEQIVQATGDVTGITDNTKLLGYANERGMALAQQAKDLQALLTEAIAKGNEEGQQTLTEQLLANQLAVLNNTKTIRELTGATMQPQSYSSAYWREFREAIYDGMGNVLPQYDVGMRTQATSMGKTAMRMSAGNEPIIPEYAAAGNMGSTYNEGDTNIEINEAGGEIDETRLAATIAFAKKTIQR